jgi:hypothetical protein
MIEEYRIGASDTNGHSARHWFRTIPQMAMQVEQIMASKLFPYRSKGDILRHALHRHMGWLASQGAVSSISGQVDVILELLRDEEMNADFLMVFDKLSDRISNHLSSGSSGEATRLIRMVQDHVGSMPEGYWRKRYQDQITMKFGHLIKGNGRASLGQLDND